MVVTNFIPKPGRIILPDVRCDLLWVDGRVFVLGPMTKAKFAKHTGKEVKLLNLNMLETRRLFKIPISLLVDQELALDDVSRSLATQLARKFDDKSWSGSLNDFGIDTIDSGFSLVYGAAVSLGRGLSVATAARTLNLSERHFARRFESVTGLRPKLFSRILRLRRAIELIESGAAMADAASGAGYADQAHFSRDVRLFSGETPRRLATHVGNVQDRRSEVT